MDDEFKLCWKNFQDNIASGFQNLYDRGDLVDVTLACDGKLLHAHKIVLAICSPYFQEIFITNPCKHPIIILKDVKFSIMCELLEFMYQGVVNVKHTELQGFMKIGQLLQVKGLATNSSTPSSTSQKSPSQNPSCNSNEIGGANSPANSCASNNLKNSQYNSSNIGESASNNVNVSESGAGGTSGPLKVNSNNNNNSNIIAQPSSSTSSASSSSPMPPSSSTSSFAAAVAHIKIQPENTNPFQAGPSLKRLPEYSTEALSIYSRKQYRRSAATLAAAAAIENDHDVTNDSMDHVNPDDFFLPTIPHISMMESRYDLNNVKRESNEHTAAGLRNSLSSTFGFDYNIYKNNSTGIDYSSDSHMPNDYSKSFGNHMDIPSIAPGERWFHGKLEFMLSQRGKPLLVHDGHTFGIQYVRKDKKYWQCNLSRKFNCKARVTTTDTGEIIVTNNEHCHTEIRQHLRKDYQRNKVMMNALINLTTNRYTDLRRATASSCNSNTTDNSATTISNNLCSNMYSNLAKTAYQSNCNNAIGDPYADKIESHQDEEDDDDDDDEDGPLDCGISSNRCNSNNWKGKQEST